MVPHAAGGGSRQGIAAEGHAAAYRLRRGKPRCRTIAHWECLHRIDRVGNATDGSSGALRSHGITAARQSTVWVQRPEDTGSRPGAVRTPQAHQLPAHGQPALIAGCGGYTAAHRPNHPDAPTANTWLRARESTHSGGGSSMTQRSPITTRSFPPPPRPKRPL